MFYQIFLSPQAKRWAIIRKLGKIRKVCKFHRMIAQCPVLSFQNESFVNTGRKLLENRKETFPVVRYFTRKLELVSDILLVIVAILKV